MVAVIDTAWPVGYFGKLPARGDFVRAGEHTPLMQQLDRWAEQAAELLARDPDWKRTYDAAPPMHFAFLGSRSRGGVGGHILASRDASERRFPFMVATRFDIATPLPFLARSPLALSRPWGGMARQARQAVAADDPAPMLRELAEARVSLSVEPAHYEAPFIDFLDLQDIGTLDGLLRDAGHEGRLAWTLPALGLLLQPVLTGGGAQIDKGLSLPLPRDPLYRPLVAAFWLDLLAGFLARAAFELAVLVPDGPSPRLVVGFNGADGRTLHAAMDPRSADEHLIRVDDAEWVEEQVAGDYGLNRLVSFLDRDELSLRVARKLFGETFLGT
jgi:type VI secretion system protein ImpM